MILACKCLISQEVELVQLMGLDQQSFPQAQFQFASFGLSDGPSGPDLDPKSPFITLIVEH